MSEDCFAETYGYGPSGSAIVGGIPRGAELMLPPPPLPPPPPPTPPVAKSRPLKPCQPSSAPPNDLLKKEEVEEISHDDVVKEEPVDLSWTFFSDPDPPVLSALDRPVFIANLKLWLELNLSKAELQSLND